MPASSYSDPRFGFYPSFGGGVPASGVPTAVPGSTSVGSVGAQSPYSWTPAYGGKPQVADPAAAAAAAAAANLKNLPNYEQLAKKVNEANYIQLMEQVRKGFPGYDEAIARASSNINAELAGQISPDVVSQLTQRAAERGIGIGSPGSPNTNAALLKAFYDTSSGQQQKGMANYGQMMSSIPKAPLMDITGLLTSSKDIMDAQNMANWIAAAADPASKAAAELAAARAGMGAGRYQTAPSGMPGSSSPTTDMLDKLLSYYTKGPSAPSSGQQGWNLPYSIEDYGSQLQDISGEVYDPGSGEFYYDPYGMFGDSYGGGDTSTMSDQEWWDTFGGGAYDTGSEYDYNFYDSGGEDYAPGFEDLIGG